jgi:hypothetical protein
VYVKFSQSVACSVKMGGRGSTQLETPVSKQTVFSGRILSVRVDTVLTGEGKQTTREIIERPDTVSVVAIDENHNILLVRQYRYATASTLWKYLQSD